MKLHPTQKVTAVLAPVFAPRSRGDHGIGTTAALKTFIHRAAATGINVVKLLLVMKPDGITVNAMQFLRGRLRRPHYISHQNVCRASSRVTSTKRCNASSLSREGQVSTMPRQPLQARSAGNRLGKVLRSGGCLTDESKSEFNDFVSREDSGLKRYTFSGRCASVAEFRAPGMLKHAPS